MRKKLVMILLTLMLLINTIPALAGGDKNHGDVGVGYVQQNMEQCDPSVDIQRCKP